MTTHSDDQLDKALDAALASYIEEPRPGLERRVLARVRAEGDAAMPSPWLRWTAAIAAAVCVIVAAVAIASHRPAAAPIITPSNAAIRPAPAVKRIAPPVQTATSAALRTTRPHVFVTATIHSPAPLPKLDQFPAASPLTDEERALQAWARRTSPPLQRALAEAQQRDIEPIKISEIQIPPLEGGDQ